jgi:HAD superfamily hydrolase (TIGR01509 family)
MALAEKPPPAGIARSEPSGRSIDVIVCDVGDVLILFSPEQAAAIERRYGLRAGYLLKAALKAPAAKQASVGRLGLTEWFQETAAILGEAPVTDWLDYHGELNLPVAQILAGVRSRGVTVLLLSNATPRLWDDLAHHGIRDLADRVFCSADIGLAKPDPRAYKLVIDAALAPPERILYVDDTASWVEAGRRAGMRGHVYRTPRRLQRELAGLGVAA